ncbi:SRPBCC family protein [Burkholderia gladioli]|uniref:SRPBCC family protein n=1 Tax=Burkholderia gladioli TaxID=28095 RepID=UPI0002F72BC2|nr:SRPBCC family protein [Burkholderia gladioli]MBW5286682.1 SRPBCC family protein [Burkholderia gladioli]
MPVATPADQAFEDANVVSVHEIAIACPAERVGALLDRFDEPDSPCWPHAAWPRDAFEGPLRVGALGGHGATRYRVLAYRPGRELVFRFEAPRGFDGVHGLRVEASEAGTTVTHFTRLRLSPYHYCMWHCVVRWVHDALIGDLLDGLERHLSGTVTRPRRWKRRVHLFRHALGGSRLLVDNIKSIWRKA